MTLHTIIYTLFSRLLLLLVIIVFAIPTAILIFGVPQRYRYNKLYFILGALIYKAIIKISLLPITIIGKHHLPQGPAIYVANHSSSLDIPMIGMLMGRKPHFWIAMRWLTNFWFFKLFLPRVTILVDMENPQANVRALIKIMQLAKEDNMSIMIFPEGQRYTDGKVHAFYGGFTLLSKKIGFPVVPIRLWNLEKVYPPNTFWIHYHEIKVVIGEPIYAREQESDEAFKERVHSWFIDQEK